MRNPILPLAILAGCFCLHHPSPGQVPVGHLVRVNVYNTSPTEIIDPDTGKRTPVTGLGANYDNLKAGALDPITGQLYLATSMKNPSQIIRVTLNGTNAQGLQVLCSDINYSLQHDHQSIAFDHNGNLFTCTGLDIYRIDRHTRQVLTWHTTTGYTLTALCTAGSKLWTCSHHRYFGGELVQYDLLNGPGPGTLLTTLPTQHGIWGDVSGLSSDGKNHLYVSNLDTIGYSLVRYDIGADTVLVDKGVPGYAMSCLTYDRHHGRLYSISTNRDPMTWRMDNYGSNQNAVQITSGPALSSGQALVVNDLYGRTVVFPTEASATKGFLFEAAAHGHKGDLAALWISRINKTPVFIHLASGTCDGGGFFPLSFPVGPLSKTVQITIQSATINPKTMAFTIGTETTITIK